MPDERCHQLLAEILRAKKPKVIIRCHEDSYNDLWMKQLELPGEEYRLVRKEVQIDEFHTTVVLQSFHPSIAVNYAAARRPEYRCLLAYHFIAAFAKLSGVSRLHEDVRKSGNYAQGQSTCCLRINSSALVDLILIENRRYRGLPRSNPVMFADTPERPMLRRKAKKLSMMYNMSRYLAGPSRILGALSIAEAVLFLWKEYFKTNPPYKQVTSLLVLRGSEQQGWFPTANHKLPLEEELSRLQISTSKFPDQITVAPDSSEIFEVNERTVACMSKVLLTFEKGGEPVETNPPGLATYNEIVDLVERHNLLINEYLREFTLTQLDGALRVSKMTIQCGILAEIIRSEEYFSEGLKEEKHEHLTLLLAYLRRFSSAWT